MLLGSGAGRDREWVGRWARCRCSLPDPSGHKNVPARLSDCLIFTPTYNERDNIGPLLDALLAIEPRCDVLIVDDSSTDGTTALLRERPRWSRASRSGPPGQARHRLRAQACVALCAAQIAMRASSRSTRISPTTRPISRVSGYARRRRRRRVRIALHARRRPRLSRLAAVPEPQCEPSGAPAVAPVDHGIHDLAARRPAQPGAGRSGRDHRQ